MLKEETLKKFFRIFQGNEAFYIHHQAPFKKEKGKLAASWCGFAVYGTKSFSRIPKGFEKGDFVPVTKELYKEHLNGGNGLAIAPLCNAANKNNICYFAAIDIDVYTDNFTWLVRRLYQLGFKFAAFLSKSGGLHIYFFFSNAEPGEKAVGALNRIVEVFGLNRLYVNDKQKSKVEVFPKQTTFIPGDKNVNGLFLPYYNAINGSQCGNKMVTAEGKLISLENAVSAMEGMFTSVHEINAVLDNLPYNDAPFCIQMILLTGALGENDGRNNFLCCAAIYLKKKYKEDFRDQLEEMNNYLEVPLEDKDVRSVYTSMTEKNYDNYWCNKEPCAGYCDRKLCKQRAFGVGRDRDNQFTGAECWGDLTRYNAGDGKEPYYTWQVQVDEGGDFKTLQIDSHADLLNQLVIQQRCLRDLNWIPRRVKEDNWRTTVLKSLVGIEERTVTVPRAADTTESAMLRDSFMRFLTHKQVQKNGQPYMVKVKQVYRADGGYYFTTSGLLAFLSFEKRAVGRVNLRNWLLDEMKCVENAELKYKTSGGEWKVINCWKMPETDELSGMDTFYDDVYEGDADIIRKSKLSKSSMEEKQDDGDDIKF